MAHHAAITVCLCTFNGAEFVGRAIESTLEQTYSDFELLVVDDASSDATCAIAESYRDSRVRLVRNEQNLGNPRNRSRAIQLARGELIKFVDQDDWIEPTCLVEHKRLFDRCARVGLTFSRRALAFEVEASDRSPGWNTAHREYYLQFGELSELNSGAALLDRWLNSGFPANWIGEPTSVMLRRAVLSRSLLFNRFLRQLLDVDLWIRVMALSDVGFLDAELATRWIGSTSDTGVNLSSQRHWLDGLWLLEGLREFPWLSTRYPALATRRRAEQKSLAMALTTGRYRNRDLGEAAGDTGRYLWHSVRRLAGCQVSLFDRIDGPAVAPGIPSREDRR
jgi:glycosyltransferase involved in cell wall biosynthesis